MKIQGRALTQHKDGPPPPDPILDESAGVFSVCLHKFVPDHIVTIVSFWQINNTI